MSPSKGDNAMPLAADTTAPELELVTIPQSTAPSLDPSSAQESDDFLVTFASPYDAENPLDWPASRKWMVTWVLSATGFNRIMVSTIMAPALSTIAAQLDMNSTESAMSLSIYLLATAFGPLFIGPLSEIYGRQVILHASGFWFFVWNLTCGFANTKSTLIASRFLAGFGASAIYSLAGGVLGDLWRPAERGRGLGIYQLIPLLGAAVGPILGGFIAERSTWRWMFWATSIFQGAMMIVSWFSFPEPYAPTILGRRARRLRKETGNNQYYTEAERRDRDKSAAVVITTALSRPIRLLLFHPIIQVSSVLSGFNYGIMYITLSTFSDLWIYQYHESIEISGLHYIACSLGELVASQVGGRMIDFLWKRKQEHDQTPESRIPLMYVGTGLTWAGLLLYGWTAAYRVQWVVVDIGVFIMMFGMQIGALPSEYFLCSFTVSH